MFAEDLAVFFDDDTGFAVAATVDGVTRSVVLDAPGADAFDGQVVTTQPSFLIVAAQRPAEGDAVQIEAGDLPVNLAHLAGDYVVRSVQAEPPDGAIVRVYVAQV